jgi:hypothetical protein
MVYLNADCSEADGWASEITKPPEHGVAEIVPHNGFPTYAKDNPRSKCNEHKVNAVCSMIRRVEGLVLEAYFEASRANACGFA